MERCFGKLMCAAALGTTALCNALAQDGDQARQLAIIHTPGPSASSTSASTRKSEPKLEGVGAGSENFQIGAGDELSIHVWDQPEATVPNTVVRPDGKISMPLIKEIAAAGFTPSQLEKRIAAQLSRFMESPDVSVIVTTIRSKRVYVMGAVKAEKSIPLTYEMNVMQALSEAGGLAHHARHKKIYVLRIEDGREFRLPFDYDAVLRGQHMEMNIPLIAGDTVVVPE